MAGSKKIGKKPAKASVKRPLSSKVTPSNDGSTASEETLSQYPPPTDSTEPALVYHGASEHADSMKTFISNPTTTHNTTALEDPSLPHDNGLRVQSTLPSTSNYDVAAVTDDHETFSSYHTPSVAQPCTSTWIENTLKYADAENIDDDRLQLEHWVYETSNSEITIAERLEKLNWQADCSKL